MNNTFLLSILLNIFLYVIVSVLFYQRFTEDEPGEKITFSEIEEFKTLCILVSIVWPIALLYVAFEKKD